MLYNTLTDAELRSLVDNGDIGAVGEAAHRFLNGSDEARDLAEHCEELGAEVSRLETEVDTMRLEIYKLNQYL